MLLSIIIINYKTPDLIKTCVDSILSQKKLRDFEIIVVDNGSGDKDVEFLQKLRDQKNFKLIISQENLGFAAGCNFGSQMAQGEFVLFLNSDAKLGVGLPGMIDQLSRENRAAIIGGKIMGENGVVEKSAGKFYNLWHLFLMLIGGQRLGVDRVAPPEYKKVDWVSGGFMLVKKSAFDELSGFDEDYFMYLEDMDICLRASKKGYLTFYFPGAVAIHRQHGSTNRSFAIVNIYKSFKTFYKKNSSKIGYNIAILLLYSKALVSYMVGAVLGRQGLKSTYREVLKLF